MCWLLPDADTHREAALPVLDQSQLGEARGSRLLRRLPTSTPRQEVCPAGLFRGAQSQM